MEKTKFELQCEEHCGNCVKKGWNICNLPGHSAPDTQFSRCGICGKIYCSEDSEVESNICADCRSIISSNVDADNEVINKNLFQHKYPEIKSGSLYEIPIGAKVKFKSEVLECCPGTCCADCFLNFSNECNSFVCHSNNREDKTEVVFKKAKI